MKLFQVTDWYCKESSWKTLRYLEGMDNERKHDVQPFLHENNRSRGKSDVSNAL